MYMNTIRNDTCWVSEFVTTNTDTDETFLRLSYTFFQVNVQKMRSSPHALRLYVALKIVRKLASLSLVRSTRSVQDHLVAFVPRGIWETLMESAFLKKNAVCTKEFLFTQFNFSIFCLLSITCAVYLYDWRPQNNLARESSET